MNNLDINNMRKIYKIIRGKDVIYIGSTKLKYLCQRKAIGYKFIPDYKECSFELIEETDDVSREQYWIDYYRNEGCELVNKIRGLTGLTPEDARKEAWKRNKDKAYLYWLSIKDNEISKANRKKLRHDYYINYGK